MSSKAYSSQALLRVCWARLWMLLEPQWTTWSVFPGDSCLSKLLHASSLVVNYPAVMMNLAESRNENISKKKTEWMFSFRIFLHSKNQISCILASPDYCQRAIISICLLIPNFLPRSHHVLLLLPLTDMLKFLTSTSSGNYCTIVNLKALICLTWC